MKNIIRFLVGIFIPLFLLIFFKNAMAKTAIEWGVERATGLPLQMGKLDINLVKTFVGIEGIQLFNPHGYPDKVMVDMPEIFVDYELSAFAQGAVHLEEMRIHLKEFVVVKNQNGQLNLDALKPVEAQKKGEVPRSEAKGKRIRLQIDRLELQIEKVVFKDYYNNGFPSMNPVVKEYKINLHESYHDITDMSALVSLIVVKALANTTIANLAHFDLGGLSGPVSDVLNSSTQMAAYAGTKAEGVFKEVAGDTGVSEELEGMAKKGTKAVKGIFGSLKKSIE